MVPGIAIVGMACRFGGIDSPEELWEDCLAQRRAFRRLPPERLHLDDYHHSDPSAADRTYVSEAAVIEGYTFDRMAFRVAGSTFRSADHAHWLALDTAARALTDAGFPNGAGLPRQTTGVLVGNSLTGEFSRANVMRLRWPYVRRVVAAALMAEGWNAERCGTFLRALEVAYKEPFPEITEESLAGGLANTIAGRIANQFGLQGGGYTVDGACASSLLAIATACSGLASGDLDVALAGGVDLSLDPFELVGFARTGALAAGDMRVFDARPTGFLPGEGCGVLVLMREEEAVAEGRRVIARIRGWGISSDGWGGLTRPEADGQMLALSRAYARAGFGIDSVPYFEAHGTGTEVGDATELRALSRALRQARAQGPKPAIGSVKALIGHTKAAAGVAGLIKGALALERQLLPPTAGCEEPHPELTGPTAALRVLTDGEPWPADRELRAGVSGMGFGGINCHVVLEGSTRTRRHRLTRRETELLASAQDTELILLDAPDGSSLATRAAELAPIAAGLSRAELGDLATGLAGELTGGPARAAVVARCPGDLAEALETLGAALRRGETRRVDAATGTFLGIGTSPGRIGFLFPGQGLPSATGGGAWRRRFPALATTFDRGRAVAEGQGEERNGLDPETAAVATERVQPAVVAASAAALRLLAELGIEAEVSVGHSLGELSALHWAGAIDEETLLRLALRRGRTMAELAVPGGVMASVGAGADEVEELLEGTDAVLAAFNDERSTVVSGPGDAVGEVLRRAAERGLATTRLQVSHAFHSPLMAPAARGLAAALEGESLRPLRRPVVSTVTGGPLPENTDLGRLLLEQLTRPVLFLQALESAVPGVDLWLEVGPGAMLASLAGSAGPSPALALEAGGSSLRGLLTGVAAAFAVGAPLNPAALFAGRFARPLDRSRDRHFLTNPCEAAPEPVVATDAPVAATDDRPAPAPAPDAGGELAPLEVVRRLVAERTELPPSAVRPSDRLLSDLHLSSLSVGQIVVEAGRRLELPPPAVPSDSVDATVEALARTLEERLRTGDGGAPAPDAQPSGVEGWVRAFVVEEVERTRPERRSQEPPAGWRLLAPPAHPLADPLGRRLDELPGRGVVLCLPQEPDTEEVSRLLEAARAVAEAPGGRLMVVQQEGGGGAFARTLHLEASPAATAVVDVPFDHPDAAGWVLAEGRAAHGFSDACYDAAGTRRIPLLRLLPTPAREEVEAPFPLGRGEVLLVTGGGKGIGAECALALARRTGVRLGIVGRSHLAADPELATNLERMSASGIELTYAAADVANVQTLAAAVARIEKEQGPIAGVLHTAGINRPELLAHLDEAAFRATLAPKLDGFRNLMATLEPGRLKLVVAFGSVIARTGLRGAGDYGVANDWLARLVERHGRRFPACRALVVEWSVWADVGMGHRLGRLEVLEQQGITPIPVDRGVAALLDLLAHPAPATRVVVAGRLGEPPTLQTDRPELPLWRFLERARVFYPGVELVVDAALSADSDPYLADHEFRGERLFPAVLGLEAMAQAACAVTGSRRLRGFEAVRFERPVVVPRQGALRIRVAALVRSPDVVDVVLRSEATGFAADHFAARCRFGAQTDATAPDSAEMGGERLALDPRTDLYGGVLFHQGRFRRLTGYRQLSATRCLAELSPNGATQWFGRYMPSALLLGDPAARDAVIHSIQACIPHATVLPVAVERLEVGTLEGAESWRVRAHERHRHGDTLTYDLEVVAEDGRRRERWVGLELRIVERRNLGEAAPAALVSPYLERRLDELLPAAGVAVALLELPDATRREASDEAVAHALGQVVAVHPRPDGEPGIDTSGQGVSVAHAGSLVLATVAEGPLSCDLEPVAERTPAAWEALLGPERARLARRLAVDQGESESAASARVSVAAECLKKVGALPGAPMVHAFSESGGWVVLRSDRYAIATVLVRLRGPARPVAIGILRRSEPAAHPGASARSETGSEPSIQEGG